MLFRSTDGLRIRLEKLGLVERSGKSRWTVSAWVADYISKRPDVKESTRRKWRDIEGKMKAFFQNDSLGDVTQQTAKNFRLYLQMTVGLSENSIRRHIGIGRQFFNAAIEAEILTKNPLRGQPVSVRVDPGRFFYVTPEIAQKVLDACPDAEWRLIFGLARWGGLRCPSEVVRLKWIDIDFEHSRFTVHSPKTEHHIGQEKRVVPMFPELRPLFQDAFDEAHEGAVHCVNRYKNDKEVNLRTQLERILKRAGIPVWTKLFQNCRSTRETELFKLTGGNVKAVCSWLGNSPLVALQHYAQVTEADLADAAKTTVLDEAKNRLEKRVPKRVLTIAETSRNVPQENQDTKSENENNSFNCNTLRQFAEPCENKTKDVYWVSRDSNPGPTA